MKTKNIVFMGSVLVLLTGLIIVYKVFDPAASGYFPKCPFLVLTGLKCPGCGSQRAIHHLLNFDLPGAARQNALLVASIPYLVLGTVFNTISPLRGRALRWRNALYGKKAIYIVLFIIIAFWVFRNLLAF